MAGETIKTEAICLKITPWSRTSHIVTWLTPTGRVTTVVKGAVRPKSAFLGQYDLNYTCELVYYARAKGDLHALRECSPINLREDLRGNYRALLLTDYCRALVGELAPSGPEATAWHELLTRTLDALTGPSPNLLQVLLKFELAVLNLSGLSPEVEADSGAFCLRGERRLPVTPSVAACLRAPDATRTRDQIPEALRALGVFIAFHLETSPDPRRTLLRLIILEYPQFF